MVNLVSAFGMYRKFNDLFSGPSNIAGPGICQPLSSFPRRVNLPEASGTDRGLGGRVHPQIAWAKLRVLRNGAAIASKKLWS